MKYPSFLNDNDLIGITACSCGVLDKIDKYNKSINNFKKYGFNVIETKNVKTDGVVSSSNIDRANELKELYINDDVKMISIARGGDFLYDMLPLVDYDCINDNVKWISGSSDPTSLLFTITTNLDIATIYSPSNMTGFDEELLHPSLINYFKIIKGENVIQRKYDKCESESFSDILSKDDVWLNLNGDVNETGRLIGGCIECLKDIIGTKYDNAKNFIEKYKDDGTIWYFDVFNMTSESLYNTLLQFKNAGWFKYTKAILIGRVAFPNTYVDMGYEKMIKKAIPDIKVVYNMDIGHVKPAFTLINGSIATIVSNNNEGNLEMKYEN